MVNNNNLICIACKNVSGYYRNLSSLRAGTRHHREILPLWELLPSNLS